MNILELKNVSAGFGGFPYLHDISFSVGEKETMAIIGPNGSGKTTLLRAIVGQAKKFGGDVTFQGSNINDLKTHQIIKSGLTLVPERNRIFTYMSVLENLELGGYLIKDKSVLQKKIDEMYATFPILKTRANQQAGTLSGGEQKMLSLARALIPDPKLLMLDEPSTGLAPKVVDQLYDIILQLNKKGLPIVLVEQNINKALAVTSETFVLNRGEIVMHGASKELLQNPDLFSAYLKGY
jgi:branched-chain amino acid transport system ATP-binding protein